MKKIKDIILYVALIVTNILILPIIAAVITNNFLGENDYYLMISVLISSVILTIFLFIINKKTIISHFKKMNFKIILNIFTNWLIMLIVITVFSVMLSSLTSDIPKNEEIIRQFIFKNPLITFINVAIFAPFIEEIIYRLYPRKFLNNRIIFIIISSLVFGFIHVPNFFTSIEAFAHLLQYSLIGGFIANMYYKNNNIVSSMIFHSLHNTMAFLLVLFLQRFF